MVSGLMYWKQRRIVFFSGTWNDFPMILISTRRSYGRKTWVPLVDADVSDTGGPVCFDMRGLSPSPQIMTRGHGATTKMLQNGGKPAMLFRRRKNGGSPAES